MSDYQRNTVFGTGKVLEIAQDVLTERAGLARTEGNRHSAKYSGGEGNVSVDAHRHGPMTTVTIRTDRLRTSKVDGVVRHLLNQLPYQYGDPEREY